MLKPSFPRVLIAGGAGFIGSYLCEQFLQAGSEVFCVDNLASGSLGHLQACLRHPRFHFIEQDIIKPLASQLPCELILNFACVASVKGYQQDPLHTLETCYSGTRNLLELSRKWSCPLVFASTSEVYGDPLQHPQSESYWGHVNPIGLRSCYDEGKRVAESLCFNYRRVYKLDVRVIRIFNTYGPRMDPKDGRVVSQFICQALQGEKLSVYGDGSQTRSFCYIDDLLEAIGKVIALPELGEPLNLGNDGEFSILQLAHKVLALTQSSSSLVFHKLPENDPKVRRPDISRARQLLNWQPRISLDEGLASTIAYLQKKLTANSLKDCE